MSAGVPAAALASINFNISLFLQWIEEVNALLIKHNPEHETKACWCFKPLKRRKTAYLLIDEAFSFNSVYFSEFAVENGLDEWIPQFLETGLRPYLQLTEQKKFSTEIDVMLFLVLAVQYVENPARLAVLKDEGKKVMTMPLAVLAHWNVKTD